MALAEAATLREIIADPSGRTMHDIASEPWLTDIDGASRHAQIYSFGRTCLRNPLLALFILIGCQVATSATAQSADRPRLDTNQAYIEEVTRPPALAITDPMAVFAFVLDSLPERVTVYPTENYYYFSFIQSGVKYAGNIRIEPQDSGGQTVHFTYYEDTSEWLDDTPDNHIVLDASHGVTVEKVASLVYRISYRAKAVIFSLNDLSQVKPPATGIGPNERFIGPIYDESGVRFFLVYNSKLKIFHYTLDETVPVADQFFSPPATDRILVGKRTGFVFYRDHHLDRKILIGAHESNMRLNNYFDGPFDQLPDNFVEGEALREAILEVQPDLKGKIDRFGSEPSGEVRYTIDPYVPYHKVDELYVMHRCAVSRIRAANYYDCFDADKITGRGPQPQLLGKGSNRKAPPAENRK